MTLASYQLQLSAVLGVEPDRIGRGDVRAGSAARRTFRSASTSTSRSAGSAVISVTSGSTPTRTRGGRAVPRPARREWDLRATRRRSPGGRSTSSISAAARPSFLSTQQLQRLVSRLTARTVETRRGGHVRVRAGHAHRVQARRDPRLGVTRLSLGVENFDDRILELNGRAHRSPEIDRVLRAAARARLSADQHRSDRRHARRDRRQLARVHRARRSSSTRQRHHLPDGAALQHDDQRRSAEGGRPVRRDGGGLGDQAALGAEAFEALERAGYHIGSAYTAVKDPAKTKFVYRDRLWERRRPGRPRRGVVRPRQRRAPAERRHLGEVQRGDRSAASCRSAAPIGRPTDERLIREFVLQLKRGSVRPAYFTRSTASIRSRFRDRFRAQLDSLEVA